jgi:protein ImuB
MDRRFLCLWAPWLSTDRVRRERPDIPGDRPLVLVAKVRNAMRVLAVDKAAEAIGLAPGLTLKAARTRTPQLSTAPFEAEADARALKRLLTLCRRFTPALTDPGADELLLDVTGTAALFGGEDRLLSLVRATFAAEQVDVRPGLADTPGLARAVARFGASPVVPPERGEAVLATLPLEALALSEKDTADLRGLGFRLASDVMERSRALLAEALEGRLGGRMDEMLGFRACPLALRLEPARFVIDRPLLEPISGAEAILHHLRRMAEGLTDQLERRRLGGSIFRLTLQGAQGLERRIEARAHRALTRPEDITALFACRLEGSAAETSGEDEAFDRLRLEATLTRPLHAVTADLWDDHAGETRFEAFVQGLAARFDRDAVEVIQKDARTTTPEGEVRFSPLGARTIGDGPPGPPPAWGDCMLRPLRLFHPPQPIEVLAGVPDDPPATIVWRRLPRRIIKAEGPERLAAEWGRSPSDSLTRDYYRVEDAEGRRYWVFRDGLFSETSRPRWYLHGLFA